MAAASYYWFHTASKEGARMSVAARSLARRSFVTDLYIDGAMVPGAGAAVSIIDPYDNSEICRVPTASEQQLAQAVEAAHRAFRATSWRALTGRDRGALLYRLAQLLRRDL